MVQQGQIQLAIVIPAYKGKYLGKTLDALACQTCMDFNVYIGNDGSPDDIDEIVAPHLSKLNFAYKKFENNVGLKSLVAHWRRCIDLTGNEPWIWLLPDDDVPDSKCVEHFYNLIATEQGLNLYRFITNHIDEQGKEIKKNMIPPEIEIGIDFIINKLMFIRNSSVAEYIFSKKAFIEAGGFTEIPLAWGADDILWFKLSFPKGIYTIRTSMVSLRQSKDNISNNTESTKYLKIKGTYCSLIHLTSTNLFKKELRKCDTKNRLNEILQFYLFNNFRSYRIKLNLTRALTYARLNQKLWGKSYLRNLYWLILYVKKSRTDA